MVVSIVTIPDDGGTSYSEVASQYQAAIDITQAVPQPQVGWTFNGSSLVSNGSASMKITKLALKNRFTLTELVEIQAASSVANTEGFTLQVLESEESVATFIDLSDPNTIQGIYYLVSVNLLTSDRANTILTTPPTAFEAYTG
jgi:hypothetical protein